jgi:hypothetical protein
MVFYKDRKFSNKNKNIGEKSILNKLLAYCNILSKHLYTMKLVFQNLNFSVFLRKFAYTNRRSLKKKEFPSIGKKNWSRVRKESPLMDGDIEYFKSVPYEWLARLVGVIDGDGYISVVKSDNRGYVSISLKIGLIDKDLPMLESVMKTLKIGRIAGPYKNIKGQETVYLIFNRRAEALNYNKYYSLFLFIIISFF